MNVQALETFFHILLNDIFHRFLYKNRYLSKTKEVFVDIQFYYVNSSQFHFYCIGYGIVTVLEIKQVLKQVARKRYSPYPVYSFILYSA